MVYDDALYKSMLTLLTNYYHTAGFKTPSRHVTRSNGKSHARTATWLCVYIGASSTGSECTAAVGKSGQVFGLPLAKCIANDIVLRREQDWLSGVCDVDRSPPHTPQSSPLSTKPSLRHR